MDWDKTEQKVELVLSQAIKGFEGSLLAIDGLEGLLAPFMSCMSDLLVKFLALQKTLTLCFRAPLNVDAFLVYALQVNRIISSLRALFFIKDENLHRKVSFAISYFIKDALVDAILQKEACRIYRLRDAEIDLLFQDKESLVVTKRADLASLILHTEGLICILELESVFGAKLPYHNLHHSLSVAKAVSDLLEGVELGRNMLADPESLECRSQASSRSLLFVAALHHDSRMIYDSSGYSRKIGISDEVSEGASRLFFLNRLKLVQRGLKRHFPEKMKEIYSDRDLEKEHFLFSEVQIDLIIRGIHATAPGFEDVPKAGEDPFNRIGTIHNGAELKTPDYTTVNDTGVFIDPELKGRNRETHEIIGDPLTFKKGRLKACYQEFIDKPNAIDTVLDRLDASILGLADLGECLDGETLKWTTDVADSLWVESFPAKSSILIKVADRILEGEKIENFVEVDECCKHYLAWIMDELVFARGRATIVAERVYYPIKALIVLMKDMYEGRIALQGLWDKDKVERTLFRVRKICQNIEAKYFLDGIVEEGHFGRLRRLALTIMQERHQELIRRYEDGGLTEKDGLVVHLYHIVARRNGRLYDIAEGQEFEEFKNKCSVIIPFPLVREALG